MIELEGFELRVKGVQGMLVGHVSRYAVMGFWPVCIYTRVVCKNKFKLFFKIILSV